ncbi:Polyadenylate-binding protein-interacting protein 5 [Morella rubra]|uniref:Polyadenylate-binding protein-interacting protein 5 n=1 Tax=Morella rubra TaxID=262757 RepID=A0A6A1UW68_9ROSI|nr:Polyadenylate-binding protein-interacting protein 5 [Morella rubra]
MKPGVSSLNPYAASYIPLSKRDANDRTNLTAKDSKSGSECIQFGNPEQLHSKTSVDFSVHNRYGSLPHNVNQVTDKQTLDEEYDMDLEYLQMTFTGLSYQSLTDVYLANNGDLDATIDMLNQLESLTDVYLANNGDQDATIDMLNQLEDVTASGFQFHNSESSETLPESLDIGDVSESSSSADYASLKLKNVEGDTSAASASSQGSATVP